MVVKIFASSRVSRASATTPITGTLSGIGRGDFRIQFFITTTSTRLMEVISQRAGCGGNLFWDIRRTPTGTLSVETDDCGPVPCSGYTALPSATRVNGGTAATAPSTSNFGTLPAFSLSDPCTGVDGTTAFVGTREGVCVYAGL